MLVCSRGQGASRHHADRLSVAAARAASKEAVVKANSGIQPRSHSERLMKVKCFQLVLYCTVPTGEQNDEDPATTLPAGLQGDPLSPIRRGLCTQCGAVMAVDAHLLPLPGGSTHFDRHKYTVAAGVGSTARAAMVKGGGGSRGHRSPAFHSRAGLERQARPPGLWGLPTAWSGGGHPWRDVHRLGVVAAGVRNRSTRRC